MGDIPQDFASDEVSSKPNPKSTDEMASPGLDGMPAQHDHQRVDSKHDTAHQSQYHVTPHQHQQQQQQSHYHHGMSQPPPPPHSGPYNMGQMANALPPNFRPGQYSSHNQPRYIPASSPPMMQQHSQFAGQGYYIQQPHMGQYYGGQVPQQQSSMQTGPRQNMPYYPNQMMMNHPQSAYGYQLAHQYQPTHPGANPMLPGPYMNGSNGMNGTYDNAQSAEAGDTRSLPSNDVQGGNERRSSTVRGPPRKPRQSGHAIWVGNLPPQTDLMSLVDHVCKETAGLESLFLISKSNCAFANFKDEETCAVAQQKLHDSKFQSVRLVSRLRKSTVEGAAGLTAPTGPSTATPPAKAEPVRDGPTVAVSNPSPSSERTPTPRVGTVEGQVQKDKFFILKSLTVEDLELSAGTGIWATQSHNEESLNNAYKSVDNVYLVFSANKSGEYFGYARMMSSINEDPAAAIEFAPAAQATNDVELPKAIPTDANLHAPRGRIIDDSARGTIFWEAESEGIEGVSDTESDLASGTSNGNGVGGGPTLEESATKSWGKPFKLEWLSTTRLPFYRTRGLRNPWNSNREVKIARDGTELEPSVGRRLIGLFNRIQAPMQVQDGTRPMTMMPDFVPMRVYGQ